MLRNHAESSRSRGFVTTRIAAGFAGAFALAVLLWWALRPSDSSEPNGTELEPATAQGSGAEAEFEAYAADPQVGADDGETPPSTGGEPPRAGSSASTGETPSGSAPSAGESTPNAPEFADERPQVVYTPPPTPGVEDPEEEVAPPPFPGGPNDRGPRVGSTPDRDQTLRIENPLPDERGAARPDLAFYQELDAAYDGLAQVLTGCARGLDPDTTDSLFVELTVTGNPDNPAQGVASVDLFGSEVLTEGRAACAQAQIRALPLPAPSHARSGESGRYTVHAETAAEYSVIFEFSMGSASP